MQKYVPGFLPLILCEVIESVAWVRLCRSRCLTSHRLFRVRLSNQSHGDVYTEVGMENYDIIVFLSYHVASRSINQYELISDSKMY